METTKIINKHRRIIQLVIRKRLKDSLELLFEYTSSAGLPGSAERLESLVTTYRNMIRYTSEGIHDPERKKVYIHLQQSIMELADDTRQNLLSVYSGWQTYWLKSHVEKEKLLAGKKIIETIDDLTFKSELDDWLSETGTRLSDDKPGLIEKHDKLIEDIFNHLWLTDRYGDAEDELIRIIRDGNSFRWYEQSIFVSAVTLSTLRTWESGKILYLFEFYNEATEQVMERAMVGLLIIMHYYNERISLYPEINNKLKIIAESPAFREHMRLSVMQFIRSRETERIGKKLHEEILPKVADIKPAIEDKLDLENLLPEDLTEGKNPDWSDLFKDSEDVYKTMEELSKLQMEGADVYMSAFANLKNFDFFRKFPNWFLPFYPDHSSLEEVFRDEVLREGTNELAEALFQTPFICNSDKYSLVHNLKHLPDAQKTMMLKVFRMELEGMEQMKDSEIELDPTLRFRTIITQYLQDFYRFFKLSPYKNEFEDIFTGKLDIYNSRFFKLLFDKQDDLSLLADYYFGKDFYNDALEIYGRIESLGSTDPQLYEKAGYCYQQEGDYEKAIGMYKKSDIVKKKTWTTKKIAYCLRRLGRNSEALEYYLEAEKDDAGNMHTAAMIGHCYLDTGDYDSALRYYFRVEYNDPSNIRVLRPIAWCYFVKGDTKKAQKYYERLGSNELKGNDYINLGHIYLSLGERSKGVEYYRRALSEGKIGRESFIKMIEEDTKYLVKNGIDPEDMPIISDSILFDLDD